MSSKTKVWLPVRKTQNPFYCYKYQDKLYWNQNIHLFYITFINSILFTESLFKLQFTEICYLHLTIGRVVVILQALAIGIDVSPPSCPSPSATPSKPRDQMVMARPSLTLPLFILFSDNSTAWKQKACVNVFVPLPFVLWCCASNPICWVLWKIIPRNSMRGCLQLNSDYHRPLVFETNSANVMWELKMCRT